MEGSSEGRGNARKGGGNGGLITDEGSCRRHVTVNQQQILAEDIAGYITTSEAQSPASALAGDTSS